MRVSREQVEANKKTIVAAAGRLFRQRGFDAVTVADVMKSAGLTHGGFYGYFRNKDELIAEALAEALASTAGSPTDLGRFARRYLALAHRDDLACGCPVAALATETIRQSGGARTEMTSGLKRQIDRMSRVAPGADTAEKRRAAIGTWAAMVGALILARMSEDQDLSDEVLEETRAWLAAKN